MKKLYKLSTFMDCPNTLVGSSLPFSVLNARTAFGGSREMRFRDHRSVCMWGYTFSQYGAEHHGG